MKTLILNGSPRENGDTVSLIREVTKKLPGDYKLVDAYRCGISPCIDCRYCWDHSGCAVKDEMQEVYEYIQECDNILIASPVYFSELTGRLLDLGSRLQTYYCASSFRKEEPIPKEKKGAVILVGGGDGCMDKAYGTACTLLHHMNCHAIHKLVYSHNTNEIPAINDRNAVAGTDSIAVFFTQQDQKKAHQEINEPYGVQI